MDGSDTELEPGEVLVPRRRRRRWRLSAGLVVLLLVLSFALVWGSREIIADNYIGAQLRKTGLPATYKIVRIGPARQILRDIVIGDPAHPDLTVAEAQVTIRYRLGFPTVGRIVAVKPRLYGSLHGGTFSFGTLDKVLFRKTGKKREFRLPDLDVAVADGRGLLLTDQGPVGFKLEGAGRLRSGFLGTFAAIAPGAAIGSCRVERASLYGALAVRAEKPRFKGPVRVQGLACTNGTAVRRAAMQVEATVDKGFDGGEAKLALESDAAKVAGVSADALSGKGSVAYRNDSLTAHYDLSGRQVVASSLAAGAIHATGSVRSQNGLGRVEVDGELTGAALALGPGLDATLATMQRGTERSLAAPILAQIRAALQRETPGSRLAASYLVRSTVDGRSIVVPSATLHGGSGATLLSLSRFQLIANGQGAPRLTGNFATGGPGLPQIAGRMERPQGGAAVLRLTMAEYRAATSSLAIPQMLIAQGAGGAIGFSGGARMSGPLPGGSASNLAFQIDGNWSEGGGLSLWRRCTQTTFDRLTYANLTLERRGLTLCPPPGGAIVRATPRGTSFAAGTPRLDLAGRLGSTPIRISGGPVGFAVPGQLTARALDVALGSVATESRFHLGQLTAQVGREIAGRFAGTEMRLHAVPMDLLEAAGSWRYARGVLSVGDATFRQIDRREDARFEPLRGTGGTVRLAGNIVTAQARLSEPRTGREVTVVDIRHDLKSGQGHADLAMGGLTFDRALQPAAVSRLFLGVVADVKGTIRGAGRIDWSNRGTTSTGQFTTDSLDFAAGFGPVKGASGTVVFTDLLGLVTAPHQTFHVASMNPGIEVKNGVVDLDLRKGSVLAINRATWPFMGGTLTLQPTSLNLGVTEARRYTLKIDGLDAGVFVEEMGLDDVSATGIFDGMLPLVFDESGGRVVGGTLNSRPPGGTVAYTGTLTKKNLSTIANFAFDALKSLEYREMRVAMDGRLTGEIVSRVTMSSVRQGAGAKQNFITRSVGKLPIQFSINVRGPFYQLIRMVKSFKDPAYVRDPRLIGLLNSKGEPIDTVVVNPPVPGAKPPKLPPANIQPSDSR